TGPCATLAALKARRPTTPRASPSSCTRAATLPSPEPARPAAARIRCFPRNSDPHPMPHRNRDGLIPPPALLHRLAHNLREGVLLFSATGALAYANPAASALCQACRPDEPESGLTLEALVPRDALPAARADGRWSGHLSF